MGWPPVDTVAHQGPGPRRARPARDPPMLGSAKQPSASSLPEPPAPRQTWTSAKLSRTISVAGRHRSYHRGRIRFRLLPMGATGPPHSVAVRPPGWRWSHPRGTRWYANGCRTGRQALGRPGADAECCRRTVGSQPLTVRPPRPRKTAAASAASMTGTSRIARILTPGAFVDPALLAARPSRLRRVSRWRQYRSGHNRDSSCSSRGISWPLVSFVNVANIDLRRGSPACSECSIRPRIRSWRAGRLIKSAPDPVPR